MKRSHLTLVVFLSNVFCLLQAKESVTKLIKVMDSLMINFFVQLAVENK